MKTKIRANRLAALLLAVLLSLTLCPLPVQAETEEPSEPTLTASPEKIDFADTDDGLPAAQAITVEYIDPSVHYRSITVTLVGAEAKSFQLSEEKTMANAGASLQFDNVEPGNSCTFYVQPCENVVEPGEKTATVHIVGEDVVYGNIETSVNLTYTPPSPDAGYLSVKDVDLGRQEVGENPRLPTPIPITNIGKQEAKIKTVELVGDSAGFFSISGSGETVAAGETIETWAVQAMKVNDAGTYKAEIVVIYDDNEKASAIVTFTALSRRPDVPSGWEITGVSETWMAANPYWGPGWGSDVLSSTYTKREIDGTNNNIGRTDRLPVVAGMFIWKNKDDNMEWRWDDPDRSDDIDPMAVVKGSRLTTDRISVKYNMESRFKAVVEKIGLKNGCIEISTVQTCTKPVQTYVWVDIALAHYGNVTNIQYMLTFTIAGEFYLGESGSGPSGSQDGDGTKESSTDTIDFLNREGASQIANGLTDIHWVLNASKSAFYDALLRGRGYQDESIRDWLRVMDGSVIITMPASFIRTLEDGTYTIRFLFVGDRYAQAQLTVKKSAAYADTLVEGGVSAPVAGETVVANRNRNPGTGR